LYFYCEDRNTTKTDSPEFFIDLGVLEKL